MVIRFLIFVILFSIIEAKDISYSFSVDNQTPYKNEAIILDVNITQLDHSKVMFFKFSPKKSSDYSFTQIDFKEDEKYHSLKYQYKYRIYPLRDNNISIQFDMVKSVTTDASVAYAISGDRDNIKGLVKQNTKIDLSPLVIKVKSVPNGTSLVGDFKLHYTIDKTITKSYEPIYLHIELKGSGYLHSFEILPKSKKYHIFTQKPKIISNSIVWDYAISSKGDFVLPKVVLNGFNPKTKHSYKLIIPTKHIKVEGVDSSSLVDKEDNPPSTHDIDWSWVGWFFSYIIVFLSGFFMPRDIFNLWNKKKHISFDDKVASVKSHKELLKLLLSYNSSEYTGVIKILEQVVYNGNDISLSRIKKML